MKTLKTFLDEMRQSDEQAAKGEENYTKMRKGHKVTFQSKPGDTVTGTVHRKVRVMGQKMVHVHGDDNQLHRIYPHSVSKINKPMK
jgi:hypothetical protein